MDKSMKKIGELRAKNVHSWKKYEHEQRHEAKWQSTSTTPQCSRMKRSTWLSSYNGNEWLLIADCKT